MTIKFNLVDGSRVNQVHSEEERSRARLARLRVSVWCGIKGLDALCAGGEHRLIMFTLTYRGVKDWAPRSMREFSRWLNKNGSAGRVWVAELQKRGAVHYHVLAAWPAGVGWVKPDASNGAWSKGFTWVTDNVRKPFYLMKYIQKGTKDGRRIRYPKGLRIYGVSRGAIDSMPADVKVTYRSVQLPGWYRQGATVCLDGSFDSRVAGGIQRGQFTCISPYAERIPVFTEGVALDMWLAYNSESVLS